MMLQQQQYEPPPGVVTTNMIKERKERKGKRKREGGVGEGMAEKQVRVSCMGFGKGANCPKSAQISHPFAAHFWITELVIFP